MDFADCITYIFSWHSLQDSCPKCATLNGETWENQDLFQHTLKDPVYGDIWDLDNDCTLAHPNCRCNLEVNYIINEENLSVLLLEHNLSHFIK